MMNRYVAFLRGINLGKRRLKMDRLAALFEQLDLAGVHTYIASGNVIFDASQSDAALLEQRIEIHLREQLGYGVDTFIRTPAQLQSILRKMPFDLDADTAAQQVHIGLFKQSLAPAARRVLHGLETPTDSLRMNGRELYWHCRIGLSKTDLWKRPDVKGLALPTMTVRKMQTIVQVHGLAGDR